MSNSTSGSNTIAATVELTDKGTATPCIDNDIVNELIERLQGVTEFENPSQVVVSASPPSDFSKIWFQQSSTGLVTNIKYYNTLTGQWTDVVSTAPDSNRETICPDNNAIIRQNNGCLQVEADKILANSTASDNLIDFDAEGALYLKESILKDVASELDTTNNCNVLQKNTDSAALSVNKGAGFMQDVGIAGAVIQGHVAVENTASGSVQTLDLSTIPNINWDADCPPTHALVLGVCAIGAGTGFSGGSWAAPAAYVSAGVDSTRIAAQMDADTQEGTDMNQVIVRLDPADPKTFTFVTAENTTIDWTNTKNQLALYIQGIIWSK